MKQSRQNGFTLVEILIVIAIMGIVSGIALPNLLDWSKGLKYKEAARTLAAVLREARTRAVAENREYRVQVDVDGNSSVTLVGGATLAVPQYGYILQKGRLAGNSTAFGGTATVVEKGVNVSYVSGWATVTAGGRPLITNQGPKARLVLMSTVTCDKSDDVALQFNPNGTSQAGYVCIMDSSSSTLTRRFQVGIPYTSSGRVVIAR